MQVRQHLQRSGVWVGPERTIAEVARIMEASGIGFVAVLDGDRLAGVVTDRDLVRRGIARDYGLDARVDSVMSAPVHTIDADSDVRDAYKTFREQSVRRLVVVDHGQFVGVLSLDELFVDLAAEFFALTAPLASEIANAHRDPMPPATIERS